MTVRRRIGRPKKVELSDIDIAIDRILKEGAIKFRDEMMALDGKAFVDRYMMLMEYIKPKLSRQEIKTDMQPVFNILFTPVQPKGLNEPMKELSEGIEDIESVD